MKTDEKDTVMTDVGARGGTRANRVVKRPTLRRANQIEKPFLLALHSQQ
jgi:hypothetical protein